ncbi:flavin reductase family protein [Streptomyces sp. NPDC101150]|uniref:flavin reductase family protein n=1 Tax=Streptomyces sp. NPDC101150 TaxID=3366114 RepID=UPI00382B5877
MTVAQTQPPDISPAEFRAAMAALAAPVTVVTCYNAKGEPVGITVSAVASLSLDPPLILVCLDRRSSSFAVLTTTERFCVNVLGTGHEDLALRFAAPGDRFAGIALLPAPAPALAAADLTIQCENYGTRDGGDHLILLGRLSAVDGVGRGGLVWHQRDFTASPARQSPGREGGQQ